MNAQKVAWFWPLSFLACLGQLLLLITDNRGGPVTARFLLAVWTLWLPGAGLGNLLTKPGTRLPARLAVEASCGLALAYLILLLREAGWVSPGVAAYLVTGLALVASLLLMVLSADRSSRRRRDRRRGADPTAALTASLATLILVVLAGVQLWAGSPLSLRPDAADQVGAIQASGRGEEVMAPRPYHPDWGTPAYDGERGAAQVLLDLMCRLSSQDADRVWNLLPAAAAPLLWSALFFAAGVFFRRPVTALAAALAALAVHVSGAGGGSLMTSGYPHLFALVPFWAAVGLYVDNLQRPHLPEVFAFALAVFATWGTHASVGIVLIVLLLLTALRSLTSVDRLQEGLPLLLAMWVPTVVLLGLHLGARAAVSGGIDPYHLPAAGLLVFGDRRWILDPGPGSAFLTGMRILAGVGLLVLLGRAARRAAWFYLVAASTAIVLAVYVPFLAPITTRLLGAHAHAWPLVLPVGFAAVVAGEWAVVGLVRSEGLPWLRILIGAGTLLTLTLGLVGLVTHYPYTPSRMAALHTAEPEAWATLADAVRDTIPNGTVVMATPRTASYLAAVAGTRSVYWPTIPWDATEALGRLAGAARAMRPPNVTAPVSPSAGTDLDAFLRTYPADIVVTNRLERDASPGFPSFPNAAVVEDVLSMASLPLIDLQGSGMAMWVDPPGPGAALGVYRVTGRPHAERILGLPESAAPGDTLRLTLVWSPDPGDADIRGYRVRLELRREPQRTGAIGGLPGRLGSAARRAILGDRSDLTLETAVSEAATGETALVLPLGVLPRGGYAIRAAILPGARSPNRALGGARLLAGEPVLGTLRLD